MERLQDVLGNCIPTGIDLEYYHTSTPPTRCAALYNCPKDAKPEKTFCEYQSLLIVAPSGQSTHPQVTIFAIEVHIYTTLHLTTVFVSKADSTGFASLLKTPKTSRSLLQSIATTFVSWIVRNRQAPNKRLVLSLFARAQDQYLFPGSVENKEKHILDDRQLVKWWCKALDPIVREYAPEDSLELQEAEEEKTTSKAYLVVPGHDKYETLSFFPPSAREEPAASRRWVADHPLRELANDPTAPPRCLVPHFPDDPKARFLDELDAEIADVPTSQQAKHESPSKRGNGHWRSVKTLEQFWDAMAFRQECSSGRLVGFLWAVFTPPAVDALADERSETQTPITPIKRKAADLELEAPRSKKRQKMKHCKKKLNGPIRPRTPRVKRAAAALDSSAKQFPETTRYYHIPNHSRGTLVLPSKSYDRVHEFLIRLDFTGLETAAESTQKWIDETAVIAGTRGAKWGVSVKGRKPVPTAVTQQVNGSANILQPRSAGGAVNMLVVKKKPKTEDGEPVANMLSGGLVRKKMHAVAVGEDTGGARQATTSQDTTAQPVNTLGGGLVRKKVN